MSRMRKWSVLIQRPGYLCVEMRERLVLSSIWMLFMSSWPIQQHNGLFMWETAKAVSQVNITEGSSSCYQCSPGRFSANIEAPSCTACPAGLYGRYHGANSSETCLPCSPGYFADSKGGASHCTVCPRGKFSLGFKETSCQSCPPGFYGDKDGMSNCLSCPGGTASTKKGAKSVESCRKICDWQSFLPNAPESTYNAGSCESMLDILQCKSNPRCVYDNSEKYEYILNEMCAVPERAECTSILTKELCDKANQNYEGCVWDFNINLCTELSVEETCRQKGTASNSSGCVYSTLYSKCRPKTKCRENKCSVFQKFSRL